MLSRLPQITFAILLILSTSLLALAAETSEEKTNSKTTVDPYIPVEELQLLLKPFTKAELLVEADGWQALVKDKAVIIAAAEIAVRRQTHEIEKDIEIQEETQEAREKLEEVKEQTKEAQLSGDVKDLEKAEQAAQESQEKIEEVQHTLVEAEDAAKKTAEMYEQVSEESKQNFQETVDAADTAEKAVGKIRDLVDDAGDKDVAEVKHSARQATRATTVAETAMKDVSDKVKDTAASLIEDKNRDLLESTAHVMEAAQEAKEEEKVDLLEHVNNLREERIVLVDNFRTVVDELGQKTDKDDSTTQAIIKDYRLYIAGVSGLHLDVTDVTSAKVSIRGWLNSKEGGRRWAKNFALFFGLLITVWFLSGILSSLVGKMLKKVDLPQLLSTFLVKAVRWAVMIAGLIIALTALEISVAPLLALVGAAGFIVAFALQDSLSNFASGLMILFFRPFDVNDVIEAGGVTGKVTSMNLVSTTIRTADNKKTIVPNNSIFGDVITNSTSVYKRRVDMEFGISYEDDIDQTMDVLFDIVSSHPKVLKKPEPTIKVHSLGDSSVNFICRPWTRSGDYWDVFWDVTREVKKRFDTEGISMPFPQQDVHLHVRNGNGENAAPEESRGTPEASASG